MNGTPWSNEQIKLLVKHYPCCIKAEDLVETIGRPLESIYYKANKIGLKRHNNIGNNNLPLVGKTFQFKKGQKPWNTGLKGVCTGGKRTQFKKGNKPWNTRYDGATRVSVDGYIEQRVSERNWQLKHRLVWIEAYGEIPPKMIVKFKDGNKLNCSIENLYISTRQENMKQNTIHQYPDELKKSIKLLNKLNRSINEKRQS
jgi:hypothetical protein